MANNKDNINIIKTITERDGVGNILEYVIIDNAGGSIDR